MPLCDETTCTASGDYINDNGESITSSGRNDYTFAYFHNISTTDPSAQAPLEMNITVSSVGDGNAVNANDLLGGLQIYDCTNLNMTGAVYTVSVQDVGTGLFVDVGKTEYRLSDDRLVWESATGEYSNLIQLTTLSKIKFTKEVK